jgi:hypothetical protein
MIFIVLRKTLVKIFYLLCKWILVCSILFFATIESAAALTPTVYKPTSVYQPEAMTGHFGVTIPIVVIGKDPDNTHAYRIVGYYQPARLNWDRFNLYFAATAGHWWENGYPHNTTINIYAIAPVFRFYLYKTPLFSPYLEASVGPAYMNHTKFGNRRLGIHYTFQDEITLGGLFGRDHGPFIALSALHYSNGRLSAHNSGITLPLMLNLGYQFG